MRWLLGDGKGGNKPRDGKRRHDLVADCDSLNLAAGLDDGADEFVAHDEPRRGRLVAAVDVEFAVVEHTSVYTYILCSLEGRDERKFKTLC